MESVSTHATKIAVVERELEVEVKAERGAGRSLGRMAVYAAAAVVSMVTFAISSYFSIAMAFGFLGVGWFSLVVGLAVPGLIAAGAFRYCEFIYRQVTGNC